MPKPTRDSPRDWLLPEAGEAGRVLSSPQVAKVRQQCEAERRRDPDPAGLHQRGAHSRHCLSRVQNLRRYHVCLARMVNEVRQNLPEHNLPERLRAATADLHAEAERAGIMPALLQGRLDLGTYCTLLRNLHELYRVLEGALSHHATDARIGSIRIAGLPRLDAIEADLEELRGSRWAAEIVLAPACLEYVRRLRQIEIDRTECLVAHAYVRYLGDLSGGQMLRTIVTRAFGLQGETGTRFYVFPEPGATALATRFRAALKALDYDQPAVSRIVDEAQHAFGLHVRLFRELATGAKPVP